MKVFKIYIFEAIAVVMIQGFLLINCAWAVDGNFSPSKNCDLLSPSLNITQQYFRLFFLQAPTENFRLKSQPKNNNTQELSTYFSDAYNTRMLLINNLPFNDRLDYGFSVICYWPTRFCSVGCRHCNYNSPKKNGSPKDILREGILQPDGIKRSIKFLKDARVKRLAIIGGGEPTEALDSTIMLIQEAEVEHIDLATSGAFAHTKENARKILDLIKKALEDRRTNRKPLIKFNIRLSIDMFHQEKISIKTLVNLFEVIQESPYKNIGFFLRSIDIIRDNTVQEFATAINGELTPMDNYVRHIILPNKNKITVLYKNLILDGRFAGKKQALSNQGVKFSKVEQFLERPGLRTKEGKFITAFTDSQIEALRPGELSGLILYNGNIFILEGSAPDNIANIYRDSFKEFQEKSFKDIITRALLTYGVEYVLKIIYEVEPDLQKTVADTNHWFHIIEKALSSHEILLYTTIRLIQNYRQENLLRENKLSPLAKKLSDLSKKILAKSYHGTQKNITEKLSFVNDPLLSVKSHIELLPLSNDNEQIQYSI